MGLSNGLRSEWLFCRYLSAEWSQRFDPERTRSELPLSKKLKMTSDIFKAKRVQVCDLMTRLSLHYLGS